MKYILTHKKITGAIKIEYDNHNRIRSFEFDCEVSDDLWKFLMGNVPVTYESLSHPDFKNFNVNPLPEDISFKAFWDAYGYKVGNKSRTEKLFNLLSEMERTCAIVSIKAYNQFLVKHPQQEKCYPETYLNQKRFENDFK